jgi:hypothetical protein
MEKLAMSNHGWVIDLTSLISNGLRPSPCSVFRCSWSVSCVGWDVDTSMFIRTVASPETLNG